MWPRKNQDEHRNPRDLIGHDPVTPENVRERVAAMLTRVEAMDEPWAAGASAGILAGLHHSGVLGDTDYALYEAEHAVRIGQGWRWLDGLKAFVEGQRD